jgi:hypothetical protein
MNVEIRDTFKLGQGSETRAATRHLLTLHHLVVDALPCPYMQAVIVAVVPLKSLQDNRRHLSPFCVICGSKIVDRPPIHPVDPPVMKEPRSPRTPKIPRSPRAAGGLLTEYDATGRLAARWRTADLLADGGGSGGKEGGALAAQPTFSTGSRSGRGGWGGVLAAAFLPEGYPNSVSVQVWCGRHTVFELAAHG